MLDTDIFSDCKMIPSFWDHYYFQTSEKSRQAMPHSATVPLRPVWIKLAGEAIGESSASHALENTISGCFMSFLSRIQGKAR